jgi:hypothetical protein
VPFQYTLKVAALVPPFAVAEIFTTVELATAVVTTVKLALEVPAEATTELGIDATAAAPLTTLKLIVVFCASVSGKATVPVVALPPGTELGTKLIPEGTMAPTVKEPFFVVPLAVADIVTRVPAVT